MKHLNPASRDRWLLLGLTFLFIGAGIGLRDPWPADEPRFVLIARQMLASGDWLIPHRGIEIYSHKPPLFMWIQAAMQALFGSARAGFLLPALFSAIVMLWLTHDLARRLWGDAVARRAGLLLLALPQFVLLGRSGQIDPVLCLWVTLGFYGFCRHALVDGRAVWLIGGSLAMGLGIITKGVGFLPLLLLPWVWYARSTGWDHLVGKNRPGFPWAGLLAALFFLAPVIIWAGAIQWLVTSTGDPDLVAYRNDLFFHQTLDRYAGKAYHPQPWWYYLVKVIPVFWLPVVLMLPALVPRWRAALGVRDARILLPLGWIVLVVLFFSISGGKRGIYLAPLLPAVALVAAPFLGDILARPRWRAAGYRFALGLALLALVVGVGVTLFPTAKVEATTALLGHNPLLLLIVTGMVAVPLVLMFGKKRGGSAYLAVFAVLWMVYGLLAYPLFNSDRSGGRIMDAVGQHIKTEESVGLVGWKEQMMLQAPMDVQDFGFSRDLEQQAESAVVWLAEAPTQRRVLIPLGVAVDCLDYASGIRLGFVHGRDWILIDSSAIRACSSG